MISKLALTISYYLAQNGEHPEQQRIYAYGVECFFNELISDILKDYIKQMTRASSPFQKTLWSLFLIVAAL